MDFFDVIRLRQSVRLFKKQAVAPEFLVQILETVRSSPTAGNLQAYQVYLTESPETIRGLAEAAYGQECVSGAPVVLVFCTDAARSAAEYAERGATLYCIQDATIAATLAHLATAALGLGSVFVGAFDEAAVAQVIAAPSTQRPIAMIPIGFPDETPKPRGRRPLDDLITRR